MLSLDYFLLVRGIEFLGASSIFTGRKSNSFSVHNYFTDRDQQPTTNIQLSNRPPIPRALAFIYIPWEKSPEFLTSHNHGNSLTLAKLCPC